MTGNVHPPLTKHLSLIWSAIQRQTTVTAYFSSEQLLLFVFALLNMVRQSSVFAATSQSQCWAGLQDHLQWLPVSWCKCQPLMCSHSAPLWEQPLLQLCRLVDLQKQVLSKWSYVLDKKSLEGHPCAFLSWLWLSVICGTLAMTSCISLSCRLHVLVSPRQLLLMTPICGLITLFISMLPGIYIC